MNDQMQHELLNRIDALAQKLGVAATAVWQMFVRQSRIDGIECVLLGVAIAVVGFVTGRLARKEFNRPLGEPVQVEGEWGMTLSPDNHNRGWLYLAISAGFAIAAMCCACNAIDFLFNPDFVAFQRIISSLK